MRTNRIALWILAFLITACNPEPAMVRQARKIDLIHTLEQALLKSVLAEKSAVLATTDEESRALAVDSQRFASEINRLRTELRGLIAQDGRQPEIEQLDAFDAVWSELEAVDKRLLALAVANTNLKATQLTLRDGAAALDQFVDVLVDLQSTAMDVRTLRALSLASVCALRVQSLLLAHIQSVEEAEMTRLEQRMRELAEQTDQNLAAVEREPNRTSHEQLEKAMRAWGEYQRIVPEVLRLSHQNTNLISFDVSIHEKHRVTKDCIDALAALLAAVKSVPQATR